MKPEPFRNDWPFGDSYAPGRPMREDADLVMAYGWDDASECLGVSSFEDREAHAEYMFGRRCASEAHVSALVEVGACELAAVSLLDPSKPLSPINWRPFP